MAFLSQGFLMDHCAVIIFNRFTPLVSQQFSTSRTDILKYLNQSPKREKDQVRFPHSKQTSSKKQRFTWPETQIDKTAIKGKSRFYRCMRYRCVQGAKELASSPISFSFLLSHSWTRLEALVQARVAVGEFHFRNKTFTFNLKTNFVFRQYYGNIPCILRTDVTIILHFCFNFN